MKLYIIEKRNGDLFIMTETQISNYYGKNGTFPSVRKTCDIKDENIKLELDKNIDSVNTEL